MIFDPQTGFETEGVHHPLTIPLPFLGEPTGLGDMVKRVTDALHIPQCGGCKERQERLNEAVEFRPAGSRSLWED